MARDSRLWLDGQPWTFLGTNFTYLPNFPLREAEASLKFLAEHHVSVIRTWVLPGDDLAHVERVLDLGRQDGLRFVITLADTWHYPHETEFYTDSFNAAYLAHVRAVMTRFRDRPEVFMWQMMNEPTCGPEGGSQACLTRMQTWAQQTAGVMRSLDACRPISVGLIGIGGTTPREEEHFRRMTSLAGVDTLTLHRYAFEDFNTKLKREMDIVRDRRLPLVWGEVYERAYDKGCRPLSDDAVPKRARLIRTDLARSFQAGVDGYLLWQFAYGRLRQGAEVKYYCGEFDYDRDDPVWDVFQAFKLPTEAGRP